MSANAEADAGVPRRAKSSQRHRENVVLPSQDLRGVMPLDPVFTRGR